MRPFLDHQNLKKKICVDVTKKNEGSEFYEDMDMEQATMIKHFDRQIK